MLSMIRKLGISSDVLYAMGLGSVGVSIVSWVVSNRMEATQRADHWGIFIGEWAPTFFAMGAAMRLEEQWGPHGEHEEFGHMRDRSKSSAMPVA